MQIFNISLVSSQLSDVDFCFLWMLLYISIQFFSVFVQLYLDILQFCFLVYGMEFVS